jgi:hypothetical protein
MWLKWWSPWQVWDALSSNPPQKKKPFKGGNAMVPLVLHLILIITRRLDVLAIR